MILAIGGSMRVASGSPAFARSSGRSRDLEAFRMRPCGTCHRPFAICPSCDRGHAYCSPVCRRLGYARTRREARRAFEATQDAKDDRADRLKEYRRRKREGDPDQASAPWGAMSKVAASPATSAGTEVTDVDAAAENAGHEQQVCVECGARSSYVRWWPAWWQRLVGRRGARRRARGARRATAPPRDRARQ